MTQWWRNCWLRDEDHGCLTRCLYHNTTIWSMLSILDVMKNDLNGIMAESKIFLVSPANSLPPNCISKMMITNNEDIMKHWKVCYIWYSFDRKVEKKDKILSMWWKRNIYRWRRCEWRLIKSTECHRVKRTPITGPLLYHVSSRAASGSNHCLVPCNPNLYSLQRCHHLAMIILQLVLDKHVICWSGRWNSCVLTYKLMVHNPILIQDIMLQ